MYYKDKRMFHSQLLKEYKAEYDGNLGKAIKRIGKRQTIVLTTSEEVRPIVNE